MITDPIRWCIHGQHMKRRDGFRPLPGTEHGRKKPREVCAECFDKIMAKRRELAKQKAPA